MRQKGIEAEELAAKFLREKNYKILARNFHSRFGEIDIIAYDGKMVVFVEVKMRSSDLFGTPLESITYSKLEKMKKTAYYYLTLNNFADKDYRFDAIQIERKGSGYEIAQVKNITL